MATSLDDGEMETDAKMSALPESALSNDYANNIHQHGQDRAIAEHEANSNDITNVRSKETHLIDGLDDAAIDEVKRVSTAVSAEDDFEYPPMRRVLIVFAALCLAIFLVALDQTIISTAIPKITDEFKALNDIGWYGSSYLLTSTALQLTYGKIYKYFRMKWVFLVAVFVFEIGSLVCATAPSSTAFIVGRAIAGCGTAGIFSGAQSILAFMVPLQKRPMFFGVVGVLWSVSSVIGPLLGGTFTDHLTWRWCFYINLPIGGVCAGVLLFVLKLPHRETELVSLKEKLSNLDFIGLIFLIPAIVCLLLALQWGGTTYTWSNSRIIGLFVGFGLLTVCFIIVQLRRGDYATIPPRLMKRRTVIAASQYGMWFGASFFLMMYYLPLYFQAIKGVSAMSSGINILPFVVALGMFGILLGAFTSIVGLYYYPLVIGAAIYAVGIGLLTLLGEDTSTGKWIGFQILAGIGAGGGFQVPSIAIQATIPLLDVPIGAGISVFFNQLGGAVWISVAQNVFANTLINGITDAGVQTSPQVILGAGATQVTQVVSPDQLPQVIAAYVKALDDAYRVSLAAACLSFLAALFVENKNIRKIKQKLKHTEEILDRHKTKNSDVVVDVMA